MVGTPIRSSSTGKITNRLLTYAISLYAISLSVVLPISTEVRTFPSENESGFT